jgi:hypothetical protein
MNCNRCGGRLTTVQHDGRWTCSHCHAHGEAHSPTSEAASDAQTARKLVILSHILGWGGLLVLLVGSIIGGRVAGGTGAAVGVGVGLVSAVTGALIGQVGRGMQGRVI